MSSVQPMKIPFKESLTCKNLFEAFQEKAETRLRYLSAAERCETEHLHVLAHAFRFTAAQEKEHAAIFGGLLDALDGPSVVQPDDPAPCVTAAPDLLRNVIQAECDASETRYPICADTARREGYSRVSMAFERIAETDRLHARRFRQFAQAMADEALFRDAQRVGWRCLPCGHLHYGTEAPELCSTCGCSRDHFIRSDFHPFWVRRE